MPRVPAIECVVPDSRVPLIVAGNVFVVFDDGAALATDYPIIQRIIAKEARQFPKGMVCLTIIPPNAKPPREEIRDAIRDAFGNVTKHLAGVCWFVEGTGFKGAAARAVISGIVMIMSPPYPSHITTDFADALAWCYRTAGSPIDDITSIALQIRESRRTVDRKSLRPA
jgi:hypothetical protein